MTFGKLTTALRAAQEATDKESIARREIALASDLLDQMAVALEDFYVPNVDPQTTAPTAIYQRGGNVVLGQVLELLGVLSENEIRVRFRELDEQTAVKAEERARRRRRLGYQPESLIA